MLLLRAWQHLSTFNVVYPSSCHPARWQFLCDSVALSGAHKFVDVHAGAKATLASRSCTARLALPLCQLVLQQLQPEPNSAENKSASMITLIKQARIASEPVFVLSMSFRCCMKAVASLIKLAPLATYTSCPDLLTA